MFSKKLSMYNYLQLWIYISCQNLRYTEHNQYSNIIVVPFSFFTRNIKRVAFQERMTYTWMQPNLKNLMFCVMCAHMNTACFPIWNIYRLYNRHKWLHHSDFIYSILRTVLSNIIIHIKLSKVFQIYKCTKWE